MSSRRIEDLCPELQPICIDWMLKVKEAGHVAIIICTWRSPAEQLAVFNSGASKRKIGPHNYVDGNGRPASKAFDFCILVNGKVTWSTTLDADKDGTPDYIELGKIGKGLGLEFGGDWKSLKDYDHLQLKGA